MWGANESGLTLPDNEVVAIAVVIAVGISLVVLGWVVARAILDAAQVNATTMVTVALSLLTLTAIGGFVLTGDRTLGTLAATGFGAIAGTVTSLLTNRPSGRHIASHRRRRGGRDTINETDSDKGDES